MTEVAIIIKQVLSHIKYWGFRFVKLMGGHIWIKSEGLGKGTTVTFIVRLGV